MDPSRNRPDRGGSLGGFRDASASRFGNDSASKRSSGRTDKRSDLPPRSSLMRVVVEESDFDIGYGEPSSQHFLLAHAISESSGPVTVGIAYQ